MPLINVKNGEVDVSSYDLRYVPIQDIVAEFVPSLNLSEYQLTTFGECFIEIKHLFSCDLSKNQLLCSPVKEEELAMAEKSAAKKDQQKNKKSKQNEKKKNQENGVKRMNEQHVHDTNHVNQKKKDKSNKNNSKSAPKKNLKSGSGSGESLLERYFQLFFMSTGYLFLAALLLYLVDYDKYTKVRKGGIAVLNKTLSFLPDEVVNKGKDILIPVAEAIVQRLSLIIKETSAFLNTNPVVKDHWTNIREIGSMCGGCLVEYLRTLYNHVTSYWCDAKSKLF